MNTSRQRMLDALEFRNPDRIPVVYHPSPAGLFVHGQRLLDLFNVYPPDNPVRFDRLPSPPPHTVESSGTYHEIRTDEWGTDWEYLIFGIQGHPKRYPFTSWKAADDYSFPEIDLSETLKLTAKRSEYLIFDGWISIFEKLHALQPFDQVLIDILIEDADFIRFLDRLVDYWASVIQALMDAGVDVIMFGDDWGTQDAPIVPPESFRKLFIPRYKKLIEPILDSGGKVFFHSCGYLGGILEDLAGLGIAGLWPQIKLFESDPHFQTLCTTNRIAIYIHPDRQYLIPKGSPAEIDAAIREYAQKYRNLGGGGIFYVEIENDAPFENVEALITSIDKWR